MQSPPPIGFQDSSRVDNSVSRAMHDSDKVIDEGGPFGSQLEGH